MENASKCELSTSAGTAPPKGMGTIADTKSLEPASSAGLKKTIIGANFIQNTNKELEEKVHSDKFEKGVALSTFNSVKEYEMLVKDLIDIIHTQRLFLFCSIL